MVHGTKAAQESPSAPMQSEFFVSRFNDRLQVSLKNKINMHRDMYHLERFSFECRKVIGFAFTTLRDWFKSFAPLFHPIRSIKTQTNCVIASRALRQLHVITSSFDWFTVLSVFFVIG